MNKSGTELVGGNRDLTRALQCVSRCRGERREELLLQLVTVLAPVNGAIARQIVVRLETWSKACVAWFQLVLVTHDLRDLAKGREVARHPDRFNPVPQGQEVQDDADESFGEDLMAALRDIGEPLDVGAFFDQDGPRAATVPGGMPSDNELFQQFFGQGESLGSEDDVEDEDEDEDEDVEGMEVAFQGDYLAAFDALECLIGNRPDEARNAIARISNRLLWLELLATAAFLSSRSEDEGYFEQEVRRFQEEERAALPKGQGESPFSRLVEELLLPRADRERCSEMLPLAVARFERLCELHAPEIMLAKELQLIAYVGGHVEVDALREKHSLPLDQEELMALNGALAIGCARRGEITQARARLTDPVRPISPSDEAVVCAYLYAAAHTA